MQRIAQDGGGVQIPLTTFSEEQSRSTPALATQTSTGALGFRRSRGERHAGVSLLILSDAPTLEIEGDFPASVLGSPAGTLKGKALMSGGGGLSGEEFPSLMSVTSEAKLRQQSEPPIAKITLLNKISIPTTLTTRTLDVEENNSNRHNKHLLCTPKNGSNDPLMIPKNIEKTNKEEMTQRWLLEQSGEDEMGIFKTNNNSSKHSSHISMAMSEPGEDEKRSFYINSAAPAHSDLKRVSVDLLTFKGLHTLINASSSQVIRSNVASVFEQNEESNAAFASSEIDIKDGLGTRDEEVEAEADDQSFIQEDEEVAHASLGCALSFLVLYQGNEGRFWISERYLNRFRYDHLVRLCVRSTSDASSTNDEMMENLHMHIVLSESVSEALGLSPNNAGLNLVYIDRWVIGEQLSLQYLLFKNFLLLVAQREGSIRILCSDKREELPTSLTASRRFWQSRSHDPTCSRTIGTSTTDAYAETGEGEITQENQYMQIQSNFSLVQPSPRTEKVTQTPKMVSPILESPLSPSDKFLRSVRGLSSVSYSFSSLEHALDDVVGANLKEHYISPKQSISSPISRRPISEPTVSSPLKETGEEQEASKQNTRDKCLSSRFSEESDREHLKEECDLINEETEKEEQKSTKTMLARIPSISKKHIKIGLNGLRTRSRSNSDLSGKGTAPPSVTGEENSDSSSSIVSRSSSLIVKINAQRQAFENAANKTIKRLQSAKNKNTYANQWTGYIKRPHTSTGMYSVDNDISLDGKYVHQSGVGDLVNHSSSSSLFGRRRGAPTTLNLNRKKVPEHDYVDHERITPATPTPNRLGSEHFRDVSPTPSTPSINLPIELINGMIENGNQMLYKPLPAVPSDVLDDGHTIDASQSNHVHFQHERKTSNATMEEIREAQQRSNGTKISLQPDRDENGSESSHQTSWSYVSSSISTNNNNRTRTDEGPACIGSSPAFNAITSQSTSLSGINLSRLIPFRARAKDLKTVSQLVKQKVENRQEFWFEANMITNNNQHKSSEKEKGSMKDRYLHSRSESVESVAKSPGKPLLLPPQQPQVQQDHDESGGTSTTPTRFTSNVMNLSPQSVQFAQRPERPKPGQHRSGVYDDRMSISEYSLASPITYSFASNDMNTPSSISTSFVSTPSPINGWKVCSENREPAVRDCVSSLSCSAPQSSSTMMSRFEQNSNGGGVGGNGQSELKKSVDFNLLQNSYRGSTDEGKQNLQSTIYSSTKNGNVKKKQNNLTEKFVGGSQQRIPLAIKSIGASRSFDLLRRNGSNSPQSAICNTADGEYINSKDSKFNKIRRKSSLGFQSSSSNQVQKNEKVGSESVGRISPRGNLLRRLRANTAIAENDSQSIVSPKSIFNNHYHQHHHSQSEGLDSMHSATCTNSPWTLVATGLEDDHEIPQQHYQTQKRVNFDTEIINRII